MSLGWSSSANVVAAVAHSPSDNNGSTSEVRMPSSWDSDVPVSDPE